VIAEFRVGPVELDESRLPGEAPLDYARRLAAAKARQARDMALPADRVALGADTIVTIDGDVLGKPDGAEQALAFLRRLRDARHSVITAVCVVDRAGGRWSGEAHTGVWLRAFSDREAETYVASGDPLDKAGGYAIQHAGFAPVARLSGSETNVIGLPVALTRRLLAAAGVV
jgi:septum formation protein